jgi:Mrp family chromosome partitioning ATPase/uncharacterized protein involved in exopolysaccharide biosynthesis
MNHSINQGGATVARPRIAWVVPALMRRARVILIAATVVSGALIAALVIRGPVYEVSASLLVKLGREMGDPSLAGQEQGVVTVKRPEDIATEIAILQSTALVGQVVDAYGVERFYARPTAQSLMQTLKYALSDAREWIGDRIDEGLAMVGLGRLLSRREKIVMQLHDAIRAESGNQSDVVRVSMYIRDPGVGVEILERLTERYLATHVQVHRSDKAETFFADEVSKIESQLAETGRERATLRQRHRAWSLAKRREHLLDWRQQLLASREGFEAHLECLADPADTVATQPAGAGAPDPQGVERERLEALLKGVTTDLQEAQRGLDELDVAELELARLDREIIRMERDYLLYAGKREEARIFAAMDLAEISNISVIAPPTATARPVAPSLKMLIAGIVVIGFGAPIGLVLLYGMLRPAVHSREDVAEGLGARVLARLPESKGMGGPPVIRGRPKSLDTEMRRLAAELLRLDPPAHSVLLTSPLGGEGASTVTALLGVALSESPGLRVLVVDACLRAPAQHRLLGVELAPGLREWDRTAPPDYQRAPGNDRLWVLATGTRQDGGDDWLGRSATLDALGPRIRGDFDFVLWDSAAVGAHPDGLVLAPQVDGVLVVVEADCTSKDQLEDLRERMDSARVRILGAIMNRSGRYWPWSKSEAR